MLVLNEVVFLRNYLSDLRVHQFLALSFLLIVLLLHERIELYWGIIFSSLKNLHIVPVNERFTCGCSTRGGYYRVWPHACFEKFDLPKYCALTTPIQFRSASKLLLYSSTYLYCIVRMVLRETISPP